MPETLRRAVHRAALLLPPISELVASRREALDEAARLRTRLEDLTGELDRALTAVPPPVGEYPPGHFHSPIPDTADIWAREAAIFRERTEIPGIDLRGAEQLELIAELVALSRDHPWVDGHRLRYRFDNHMFARGDALVLHAMLRRFRPPRVVEVGSGFSSALMLDTDDVHLGGRTDFTFIDPDPARLQSLLNEADRARVRIIAERAELLDPKVFATLQAGDLLFIDSSHVSRIGSDVNFLFLEVLPQLPAGVLVHVHDIPWPFEYWSRWVAQGRYWNEAYLLRALLVDNPRLRIVWFSSYLARVHRELMTERWPEFRADEDSGASLWLVTA